MLTLARGPPPGRRSLHAQKTIDERREMPQTTKPREPAKVAVLRRMEDGCANILLATANDPVEGPVRSLLVFGDTLFAEEYAASEEVGCPLADGWRAREVRVE